MQALGQIPLTECQLHQDSSLKHGFIVRAHVTKRDYHIGAASDEERFSWYAPTSRLAHGARSIDSADSPRSWLCRLTALTEAIAAKNPQMQTTLLPSPPATPREQTTLTTDPTSTPLDSSDTTTAATTTMLPEGAAAAIDSGAATSQSAGDTVHSDSSDSTDDLSVSDPTQLRFEEKPLPLPKSFLFDTDETSFESSDSIEPPLSLSSSAGSRLTAVAPSIPEAPLALYVPSGVSLAFDSNIPAMEATARSSKVGYLFKQGSVGTRCFQQRPIAPYHHVTTGLLSNPCYRSYSAIVEVAILYLVCR